MLWKHSQVIALTCKGVISPRLQGESIHLVVWISLLLFQKSVETPWAWTRTDYRLENSSHVLLLSFSHRKLSIQQMRHLPERTKEEVTRKASPRKRQMQADYGKEQVDIIANFIESTRVCLVPWEPYHCLLIPEAANLTTSRTTRTRKLAFQAPLLALYPILSFLSTLPSSSGNSQAGLARTLFFYSLKYSATFYICYWEILWLVLIFLSTAALLSAGICGDGSSLENSKANTQSKCLWVQCQTKLPPRVNACQAEMLFIFGRLSWLRSLKKDMLKAFWAISSICK